MLNFSAQEGICSPGRIGPVTVIGAGSVGGQVVMQLARVGVTDITVWDADYVESANIPMSGFGKDDVGLSKVHVVARRVMEETGVEVKAIQRMFEGEEPLRGSVVACVDTMRARSAIWRQVRGNPLVGEFVDTRVADMLVNVYRLRPTDPEAMSFYEGHLYPDSDVVRLVCGRHGIVYVTGLAASIAVGSLVAMRQGKSLEPLFEFTFASIEQI